jgi:hypothetical protein
MFGLQSCNYHVPADAVAVNEPGLDAFPGGAGTSAGGAGTGASVPAFQLLSTQLFKSKCSSCHNASNGAAGIDLSSHGAIVAARNRSGTPVVTPRSADNSLLVQVIENGRMPPRGGPVDAKVLAVLKCWVAEGAPAEGATACVPQAPANPANPGTSGGGGSGDIPPAPAPGPQPGEPVTFSFVFSQVLEPWCVGCHAGSDAADGVDLSSFEAIMSASQGVDGRRDLAISASLASARIKRPLVEPGDPEGSKLWRVVRENEMPYQMDPLAPELKSVLRQWILDGARP